MRLKRVVYFVLKGLATVAALVCTAFLLLAWFGHPKFSTDNIFIRPAGTGVFKMSDIPRGRALNTQQLDQYAGRLLAEMTLTEKVHQMSGDTWLWDMTKLLTVETLKYNDSPILAGRNRRLQIPAIAFSDGPRGVVLHHSTCFPAAMARGASWDLDLERRVGDAMGQEIRAQNGNLYGGLCLNLLRHPGWGRAQETFGEDPYLLGEMAVATIEGVQRNNVMACAKHYAMNSIEQMRTKLSVNTDERTLREVYLPHFKRAVDGGAAAVMSSYNRVRGDYAAENTYLLRKILKEEWGFRGFVMSDFFFGVYDGTKAANAGLDMEMPATRKYGKALIAAVEKGDVPREFIDDAVRRILRRKIEYAARPDPMRYDPSLVVSKTHIELAREAAEKSMVLLKNDANLLPLNKSLTKTLAVIGRLADTEDTGDHGSSRVYPPYVVTPLEGLRRYLGANTQVNYQSGSDLPRARQLAKSADAVVIVAGLDFRDEGEYLPEHPNPAARGGDRKNLHLRPEDVKLIQELAPDNPRTVVVLVGGSAILMEEWKDKVNAILMAWYPGMEGGTALARILFGDVNPSGKLTVTFAKDASQLPPFDPPYTGSVDYGYYHGYTLAEKKGYEPSFPFGYGLSYTSFKYSNLKLGGAGITSDGELPVSVDVANTGKRSGEEIVQLYVGFPNAKMDRPVKLLRGFAKIPLSAGEKKTVMFTVRARDLAYFDPESSTWRIEPVVHQVLVGGCSRAADLLQASFRITAPSHSVRGTSGR
jgi:beta-glucosidase